jgi:ankyrin repeat protein
MSSSSNNDQRANHPNSNKGAAAMISTRLSLYSESCLALLEQALARAVSTYPQNHYFSGNAHHHHHNHWEKESSSSLSSDDKEENDLSSSEDDNFGAMDQPVETMDSELASDSLAPTFAPNDSAPPYINNTNNNNNNQKKTMSIAKVDPRQVQRRLDGMPCVGLEISEFEMFEISSSLLRKTEIRSDPVRQCQAYVDMVRSIVVIDNNNNHPQQTQRPVIILCLRSGKFAGGVFIRDDDHHNPNKNNNYNIHHPVSCIDHRTLTRYTVRKKQGKAQSTQDGSRRPQSMGAQLRRHGEMQLQQDIQKTLREWRIHFQNAALIWISIPKTMKQTLFGNSNNNEDIILQRDDPRIRRVPLDLGRPTFETVCLIHTVLMTATIREKHESFIPIDEKYTEETTEDHSRMLDSAITAEPDVPQSPKAVPLSPLHQAVVDGDLKKMHAIILQQQQQQQQADDPDYDINSTAGDMGMTPLHYAAFHNNDDPDNAAEMVRMLLEVGRANPCLGDDRRRVPYYLASHEKIRDAFRIARARLGEEYCAWDEQAKVGPPLTKQDLELRKEKEAEKKRKKRARMKEKKAKEKAEEKHEEELRMAEEKRKKEEEDAKRVRDGLQPKMGNGGGGVLCDFCQKQCQGKQRAQMFKRLSYSYCSTECVQKHKRELMAAAATARFSGTG